MRKKDMATRVELTGLPMSWADVPAVTQAAAACDGAARCAVRLPGSSGRFAGSTGRRGYYRTGRAIPERRACCGADGRFSPILPNS